MSRQTRDTAHLGTCDSPIMRAGSRRDFRGTGRYVDKLAKTLKSIPNNSFDSTLADGHEIRVIEISAGHGHLIFGLQSLGVNAVPTDVNSRNSDVESLSALAALKHYNPSIVICFWSPINVGVEPLVLNYPSVECFVYICRGINGEVRNSSALSRTEWKSTHIEVADQYSLSRYDCTGQDGNISKHSYTFLLTRRTIDC